ncbi:hypothetical protein GCM10008933_01010 [Paenibacillus motobuensis]|uniref:Uncharacterized protein n=2 Tax=Paenibacillus motobuensis TaxID=295324 RepID=A0ABN0XV77_9BACL
MKQKSRYPISYHLGYRAGQARGFTEGREAGYQRALRDVRATGREVQSSEHSNIDKSTILSETKKTVRVLIISAIRLPSYQIGIRQPLSLLESQGHCTFEVKSKHEVTEQHVADADIVIVQRSVEPRVYKYFELARILGKRTVYVIDDYYEALPQTNSIGKYYAHPDRQKAFADFLKNADIVKVDAPYFGKLLVEKYNSNVIYFPASVDFAWIEQVEKKPKNDSVIVIGYEGANKEQDFVAVVPALLKILNEYGKFIKLEFYGFVPESLSQHPSVSYNNPEADYRTFIRKLYQSNWDIGLAPLDDTPFNHCKTNNKFREYAACGIPGIYSSSPAYTDWVVHRENGIIVPHTEEGWYEGMKQLIEDRLLRARIKERAAEVARKHFTINACAEQWKEQILHI